MKPENEPVKAASSLFNNIFPFRRYQVKTFVIALVSLFFGIVSPSTFADEAKAPNAAAAGATVPTALLEKTTGEWRGDYQIITMGSYLLDVKASLRFNQEGGRLVGFYESGASGKVPITSVNFSEQKISFEASDAAWTRKFDLEAVDGVLRGKITITAPNGRTVNPSVEFKKK